MIFLSPDQVRAQTNTAGIWTCAIVVSSSFFAQNWTTQSAIHPPTSRSTFSRPCLFETRMPTQAQVCLHLNCSLIAATHSAAQHYSRAENNSRVQNVAIAAGLSPIMGLECHGPYPEELSMCMLPPAASTLVGVWPAAYRRTDA